MWHYLTGLWAQVYPNLIAGLFPSSAVVASHVKRTRTNRHHHEELKKHITDTGQCACGHDKLHN